MLVTVTFCGLVVAPAPVAVKLNEYMPLGKLVLVKAMLPFVPAQVVGLVPVPTVKVGAAGSVKVLDVATVPVQPLFVTEKAL
ncbi:MAG: hypothetical protein EAZ32_11635 [Cytophagia bacterium]|nr:MAG: hypothetical protein EAZ46_06245 [Runella sp.]TAG19457.1 MAG: hypothetical protein EAZ38_12370 [Cytophagales bacterium]TAG38738.1 MAG: hypothetical protein EAZ32_11635 [Cytophagia bacterium]TAG80305.1 MAG: hypothetical protein EAZ22_09715 [Cytophagales bacterium]